MRKSWAVLGLSAAGLVLALTAPSAQANSGAISTVAGTIQPIPPGPDFSAGGLASFGGLLFASDPIQNAVFAIDGDGNYTVIAGTGARGSGGDGGPATEATLDAPRPLAATPDGGLWLSTARGLRRISGGTITTVTSLVDGWGPLAPVADGSVLATIGSRVVSVAPDGTMVTVAGGGTTTPADGVGATAARFDAVGGLTTDGAGRVYIADSMISKVYRVEADQTLTVVAGRDDPSCDLSSGPCGGFSGDGGPATEADLWHPGDLASLPDGLLIVDRVNYRVRLVDSDGIISTVAGNGSTYPSGDGGPASAAGVPEPSSLAPFAGGFAVGTSSGIRLVAADGTISTLASGASASRLGDGGPAVDAHLAAPRDTAVGPDGSVYVADALNHRVRRIAADGVITTFAGGGTLPNCCDSQGAGDGGPAVQAALYQPTGVTVGPDGSVFISESNRVRRVAPDGTITTFAGSTGGMSGDGGPATDAEMGFPFGLAFRADGSLLIADKYNGRIRRVDPDGVITTFAGTDQFGPLNHPGDLAVGPDGTVYVSQSGSLKTVGADGSIATVGWWPANWSDQPPSRALRNEDFSSVAVDGDGAVYVAEGRAHRVRRLNPGGDWETIAGVGLNGFSGDGGPASEARLSQPSGIAVSGTTVFVADTANDRLRAFSTVGDHPSTTSTTPESTTSTTPESTTSTTEYQTTTTTVAPPPSGSAPSSSMTIVGEGGDGGWYRSASVTVEASDPDGDLHGIRWQIENPGGWVSSGFSSQNPISLPVDAQGMSQVSVSAVDWSGLEESWQSVTVAVDQFAPRPVLDATPGGSHNPGSPVAESWTVSASCDELASSLDSGCRSTQVTVNGEPRSAGEAQFVLSTPGSWDVTVTVSDRAGNTRSKSRTLTVAEALRLTPVLTPSPGSHTPRWAKGWDLSLSCSRPCYYQEAKLAQHRDWQGFDSVYRVETEGRHEVSFRASDEFGRLAEGSVEAWVDRTGPRTLRVFRDDVFTSEGPFPITLYVADFASQWDTGSGVYAAWLEIRRCAVPGLCFGDTFRVPAEHEEGNYWVANADLTSSYYEISAFAEDQAGNVARGDTWTALYLKTDPVSRPYRVA